jgi:glucoamylase
MRLASFAAAFAAASIQATLATPVQVDEGGLFGQIEQQNKISFNGVLNNIGPNGQKAPGASAGVIIASPSTQDPDCE